ncbi:hypothetical protein BEL04_19310 [Mucilaginibacter sp. PPCGB 2223]|nr:hypothetical protein BEL04_19310 [Mucilaginibacter sp. PPCGB 2223]
MHTALLFMSGMDITVILAVALLLFGGKKMPELARGLGSGIKEFKDASSGVVVPIADDNRKSPAVTTDATPVMPVAQAKVHGEN